MEPQAKERITGGIILVVLLVLLVPELLTGPRPAPQPAPAQPDQAPMRSYTLDLNESAHANSAPVAASTSLPSAPVAAAPAPVPTSVPAPVPTAAPPPALPRAAPPPTVPARPVAQTPPAAPAERHGDHASAGWSVQLGTFSSRENAAHLVASLKSHGFSASIGEASRNGRKLYRVRVGAERDRAAAQKLLGRLKAAGEKGGEVVPR